MKYAVVIALLALSIALATRFFWRRNRVLCVMVLGFTAYAGLKQSSWEYGVNKGEIVEAENAVTITWTYSPPVSASDTLFCDWRLYNSTNAWQELFSCPVADLTYTFAPPAGTNDYEIIIYTNAGSSPVHTNGVFIIYCEDVPETNLRFLNPQAEIRTETETYKAPNAK